MKNIFLYLLVLVMGTGIISANDENDATLVEEEEDLVGVYYYPWHGDNNFHGGQYLREFLVPAQLPELGEYNDREASVIEQHFEWSEYAGINLWVCSWWGPDRTEDITLRNHVMPNPNINDLNFALFYETTNRLNGWSSTENVAPDIHHMARHYWNHPNYLKIDGRPVLFIYLTRVMEREEILEETIQIMREEAARGGHDIYIVGDHVFGSPPSTPGQMALLDAVTNFDVYGSSGGRNVLYATQEGVDNYYANMAGWKSLVEQVDVSFIPAVSPGYNDSGVRPERQHQPLSRKLSEDDEFGSLFKAQLEAALEITDPDVRNLFMINSWNEWHEDTQIEPVAVASPTSEDVSGTGDYTWGLEYEGYGMRYLNILREALEIEDNAERLPETFRYMGSGDWTEVATPENEQGWRLDDGTFFEEIPGAGDQARINWEGNTVTITSEVPTIQHVRIGIGEDGTLIVADGGSIHSTDRPAAGWTGEDVTGTLIVQSGGTFSTDAILWIAHNGTNGVMIVEDGGVVTVGNHLWWAPADDSVATVEIAGTVNQTNGILGLGTINAVDPSGGIATVYIHGDGQLNLNNIHGGGTSIQPGSYVDLSGNGRLTVTGNHVGSLEGYVENEFITGNGRTGLENVIIEYDSDEDITTVAAVPLDLYEKWLDAHFPDEEDRTNPELIGRLATPAGDGIPNLLKYAFGFEPMTPVAGANLPQPETEGDVLTLTYPERVGASDITYVPEKSFDLIEWDSEAIDRLSPTEPDGEFEWVTVQLELNGEEKAFLRVNVIESD